MRQFGARFGLDGIDQPRHHVVEHADLIFGIVLGAVDEEIGDAGEDLDPAGDAAGCEGGLEFVKKGKGTHHILRAPPRH